MWKKYCFQNSPVLRNWSHFWEVWQFSTHPRCVRVCGKLPNLPNMASVSQNRGVRKYLRCCCLTHVRLCILEWSNWPEILVTALVTPLSWAVHCVTVSPIDVANKIMNAIWATEGPLNAWKVIPTHCQGAQGHFWVPSDPSEVHKLSQ